MLLSINLFMFDIGWGEFLLIGIVALIAIGPKELPSVLRSAGQWIGKARRMAAEFQGQFQEAMREAEMADIKKQFDEAATAATDITSGLENPLETARKEMQGAFDDKPKPADATTKPETAVETATQTTEAPSAPAPVIDLPLPEPAPPIGESDFAVAETPKPDRKAGEGGAA